MASPSQPKWTYEVFLSFRGSDVRDNFISHLSAALKRAGICTFIDDEALQRGEWISPALRQAIEESRIAVIIFSENYADSRWCLDELVHIVKCKKKYKLIVLPVFYKVEPGNVRSGGKSFGKALDIHERECKAEQKCKAKPARFTLVDVENWRKALGDAGGLSGWEYNGGSEEELVQKIVRDIWVRLERTPLHVDDFLVGIDSRVEELIEILKMKPHHEVATIGLWAMGGMGKTTLAKALYNSIFTDFEAFAFVGGITGTKKETKEMTDLQENLLSSMLMTAGIRLSSDAQGSNLIRSRLHCKRVLLILDGVDDICQINSLAGQHDWFGKGSRIIITTRYWDLLKIIGADIHEVQPLDIPDARKLFEKHACRNRNRNRKIKEKLVDQALRCTERLPLALELLGSAFAAREQNEWKFVLDGFAESSLKSIDEVFRVSYNGLDPNQQEIFLHIACFFNGWSRRYVESVLKNCGLPVSTGINDLIRRSLIRDENGTLKVHDLIETMGKNIVKQKNADAARRSRLWLPEEVLSVLSRKEGTDAVEAIVLALPKLEVKKIPCEAFAKLNSLKILIMVNVQTDSQGPVRLPSGLRWFEWPECRAPLLSFDSSSNTATTLAVRRCLFEQSRKP